MEKKLWLFLACSLVLSVYAEAGVTRYPNGIVVGTQTQETDSGFTVGDGDLYVQDDLIVNGYLIQIRDVFNDMPAPAENSVFDVDFATTTALVSTTTVASITQMALPMNVTARVTFDDGVATTTVTGTMVVTGVNARGESTTETLTVSTTTATGAVAWSTISNFTWTLTAISGRETTTDASFQVGVGGLLGLSNDLAAAADVLSVTFDDSGTSARDTTYTANTTYDTIDTATAGDGTTDVVTVLYKTKQR